MPEKTDVDSEEKSFWDDLFEGFFEEIKQKPEVMERLQAAVLVDFEWALLRPNRRQTRNLERWYKKWALDNPVKYINMTSNQEMPDYETQMNSNPKDYERDGKSFKLKKNKKGWFKWLN